MSAPSQRPERVIAITTPRERLESWKEIAAYLKRDVRTVQRWEKSEDLPVYRHMHGKLGSVYAYRTEVDAWWNNRRPKLEQEEALPPAEAVRPKSKLAAIALFLGTLALLGGVVLWRQIPRQRPNLRTALAPVSAGRLGLTAFGEGGRLTWIPVGRQPDHLVMSPSGDEIYVLNIYSSSISLISTGTNTVTRTVPVAEQPEALALSPDGQRIYVGHRSSDLTVLDAGLTPIGKMPTGSEVRDIAATPDGKKLYLAMSWSGLKRVFLDSGQIESIPTVGCPYRLALSPDGTRLYVNYRCSGPGGRSGHNSVAVFDTATDKMLASINGFPNVGGQILTSPDGAYVWAHGEDACGQPKRYDGIGCPIVPGSVINTFTTADNRLIRTLGLRGSLGEMSFLPDGSRVLVGGDSLEVMNPGTFQSVQTLPITHAKAAVFTPDGQRAYMLVPERDSVVVLDVAPASCAPSPHGLTAYWPGDGNANDIQQGWHGELRNGAAFSPGRVGLAFALDGVDDSIQISSPLVEGASPGEKPEHQFTMAAWVKFNRVPAMAMSIVERVSFRNTGKPGSRLLKDDQGRFIFCYGGFSAADCLAGESPAVRGKTVAVPSVWFHVAAVKGPGKASLYVNGTPESTQHSAVGFRMTSAGDLWIGANPVTGSFLDGLVDEVVFYSQPLTAEQIRDLYDAGNAPGCRAHGSAN